MNKEEIRIDNIREMLCTCEKSKPGKFITSSEHS